MLQHIYENENVRLGKQGRKLSDVDRSVIGHLNRYLLELHRIPKTAVVNKINYFIHIPLTQNALLLK